MQKLPVIQSLWIGQELSVMEQLSILSFLKNGHSFHLYVYDKVEGIPEGVVVKDANEIIPSNQIFKYKNNNSYAGFSNLFRYKLLLEKGNYWVDTDVICLKPFTDDSEYIFASERIQIRLKRKERILNFFRRNSDKGIEQFKLQIASCVIKAPKGSKIMEYCYAASKDKNTEDLKWGETGPKLVHEAVKRFNMESYVKSYQEYCPVDYDDWRQLIDGSLDELIISNAKAVHLWNEMWRRNKIDKSEKFDEQSIYEKLKRKYFSLGD